MPERVEKHGEVHVVVGRPRLEASSGELCRRCGLAVQEHSFLWTKPGGEVALRLFVEACHCGVRFTDRGDQPLDETPQLWGIQGKWWCDFCDFRTDDRDEYLAHSCLDMMERHGEGRISSDGHAP
jgi:hypothetical protein